MRKGQSAGTTSRLVGLTRNQMCTYLWHVI